MTDDNFIVLKYKKYKPCLYIYFIFALLVDVLYLEICW